MRVPAPLSRRRLIGGGLAAGGAVVLDACIANPDPPRGPQGTIIAGRVRRVPADDPGADAWDYGASTRVALDGQLLALPFRATPAQPSITVSAIHDGERIGFRLRWQDRDPNDLTVACDGFRDACAVLLGPGADAGGADSALRMMGTASQPVTILQWKADWQRDVAHGRQGPEAVFPNLAVDTYPHLGPAATADGHSPVGPAAYEAAHATQWLPALRVGNPLAAASRTSPIDKLVAGGFGSAAPHAVQDAEGAGVRHDNGWQVAIVKPLSASSPSELELRIGGTYTCAFAIWSGGDGDAGGRKSPSKSVFALQLEA